MISQNAFDGAGARDGSAADGPVVVDGVKADEVTADDRVVVGFDGSAGAWDALRWAADDAGGRRSTLEVVCCAAQPSATSAASVPGGASLTVARRLLKEAAWVAGLRGLQIQVHASFDEGSPGEVLVERSRGAVELVLGHHDRGAAPAAGQESLSAYCRTNALCPVTVVDSTSQPDHLSAPGSPVPSGRHAANRLSERHISEGDERT